MQSSSGKIENENKTQNNKMEVNKLKKNNNPFFSVNNFRDLYSGILTNLMYALPSDWLKFLSYEFISKYFFGITISQGNFLFFCFYFII